MVHNVIMMSDLLSQTSVLVSCSKSAQLFVNSGATMFKFPSPRKYLDGKALRHRNFPPERHAHGECCGNMAMPRHADDGWGVFGVGRQDNPVELSVHLAAARAATDG